MTLNISTAWHKAVPCSTPCSAAIENHLKHGVRQRYQRKVQQMPSASQQLQSSSKRQKRHTAPTDSPNVASKGSEMSDAERPAFPSVTPPRMNTNAVLCGLSTPSRQRCGHMAMTQRGWQSDPVVAAKQYRK
ncbi:hypothetical protein TcCL_Unassigned02315 [Trypanosoma cruzi]|nr:hypothetical protein TcCL_Unassigned02315 [Trypanosoma cruzi]